jgi:hypothetical protein
VNSAKERRENNFGIYSDSARQFRHSRAGGNPDGGDEKLDSRLRGNDRSLFVEIKHRSYSSFIPKRSWNLACLVVNRFAAVGLGECKVRRANSTATAALRPDGWGRSDRYQRFFAA